MLLKAIEVDNIEALKNLINFGFDVNFTVDGKFAADLAYERRKFSILLELLKSNSKFPKKFKISKVPKFVRKFAKNMEKVHEIIKNEKFEEFNGEWLNFNELGFDNKSFEDFEPEKVKSSNFLLKSLEVQNFVQTSNEENFKVQNLNSSDLEVQVLNLNVLEAQNLNKNDLEVQKLNSNALKVQNLNSNSLEVQNMDSNDLEVQNLNFNRSKVQNLNFNDENSDFKNSKTKTSNLSKFLKILNQNQNLKFFYDTQNNSALSLALKLKKFNLTNFLISKNIFLASHEILSEITKNFKLSDRIKFQEIFEFEHILILMSNSKILSNPKDFQKFQNLVKNSFEILSKIPEIEIILKIVAFCRNFQIIFDFNCESVKHIDRESNANGLFYPIGRIYIAARNFLDHKKFHQFLGVISHELCHLAMLKIYKNSTKPYKNSKDEENFKKVLKNCKENCEKLKIIKLIFECYQEDQIDAELIARIPQIFAQYQKNEQKLKEIKKNFKSLFEFYENCEIEMRKKLNFIKFESENEIKFGRKKFPGESGKKSNKKDFLILIFSIIFLAGILGFFIKFPVYKWGKFY